MTATAVLVLFSLSGCENSGKTVSTDGSTSMERVVGILEEAFDEANEEVTFTYNPTGSGAGITAVLDGRCDIGLSSWELNENEFKTDFCQQFLPTTALRLL